MEEKETDQNGEFGGSSLLRSFFGGDGVVVFHLPNTRDFRSTLSNHDFWSLFLYPFWAIARFSWCHVGPTMYVSSSYNRKQLVYHL